MIEALRKLGHLIGYGLVCVAFFATTYWWLSRRRSPLAGWALKNRAAGWALILTTLLGSADELHQRYVPQRTSTITDVGFDLCGGYFSLMILFCRPLRLLGASRSVRNHPGKTLEQATG